jgi:hypothetical protein
MVAFGAIAAQTMRGSAVSAEPQPFAQTISPFERMQNARGLPVQVAADAF